MRSRQQGFFPLLPLLGGLWDFLTKIPWWVWVIVAAVIFHFWSLHVAVDDAITANDQKWQKKEDAMVIKHNADMLEYRKESVAKSTAQQIEHAKVEADLEARLQDALKRIPQHVTKADDQRCGALPSAGLRDLADLATGKVQIPGVTSGPLKDSGLQPGASSPVYLSALFASDATNIKKLKQCGDEVEKWRSWYVEQRALCKLKDTCE